LPYCKCDNCGYVADVPYIDEECPKCHMGKMQEMEEEVPSKFPAIVVEGDQSLTVLYLDRHKRLAIRQFWFEMEQGKFKCSSEEIYIEDDEKEDFKEAINEILAWAAK